MRETLQGGHHVLLAARRGFCKYQISSQQARAGASSSSWKDALEKLEQHHSIKVSFSTYASILRGCCSSRCLPLGRRAHSLLIAHGLEHDHYLGNLVLLLYCTCGAYLDSFSFFCRGLHARNVFSWAIIIKACAHHGHHETSLQLFQQMHVEGIVPDAATLVIILSVCAQADKLHQAMKIHTGFLYGSLEGDPIVGTTLINMYSACSTLQMARRTFNNMHIRNVVSWTAIIASHSRHGHGRNALILFEEMQMSGVVPNEVTYLSLIEACASDGLLAESKQVHACIIERCCHSQLQISNALITTYSECGSLHDAISVFNKMISKDVVSWTSIITAYVHHGSCRTAWQHFEQMHLEGFLPDRVTFISIVDACAVDATLVEGTKVHLQVECCALNLDVAIGTALVNMYGRCGKLSLAERIFHAMPVRNLFTWNSIVAALAQHGKVKKAFHYFRRMELDDMMPDIATFSSILCACAHAGLVEEGFSYALKMHQTYGIEPTVEHYNCLVGLLGRLGLVKDGKALMGGMPLQPTASSWVALLGACKAHLDLKQGEFAAHHAFETSLEREAPHIVLSDLRAAAVNAAGIAV